MAKSICPDHAESIYWMVQTMEAWFHADKESMAKYRNKTTHGPKLLSLIDPELVKNASPNCNRLFAALTVRLSPSAS
jgi:hypothetical protein